MSKPSPMSTTSIAVLVALGAFEAFVLLLGMGRGMVEGDDLGRDLPVLGSLLCALATLGVACTADVDDGGRLTVVLLGSALSVALGLTAFA